ncbi:MAG: phosphodiester glycosidase family protein [Abditibacteriaceae bacterium]
MTLKSTFTRGCFAGCIAAALIFSQYALAQAVPGENAAVVVQPGAATVALPATPPFQEKYLQISPGPQTSKGQLLLPASFLQNQLGINVDTIDADTWKLSWFEQTVQMDLGSQTAKNGSSSLSMSAAPIIANGQPYFPWTEIAKLWNLQWKQYASSTQGPVLWVRYQSAFLNDIRYSSSPDKFRVVYEFSNPTLIQAQNNSSGPVFTLSAARQGSAASIPTSKKPGDNLISSLDTTSGNWQASLKVLLRYQAPVSWFTMADPPRLVVDVKRDFEEVSTKTLAAGLTYEHIRRGIWRGPQLLYVVRANPSAGWRLTVANGGYSVLQRDYTSHVAKRHKAPVAVNGGFFAYDGAAVGAVKIQGEWMRLPWPNRSVIGIASDGSVKIGKIHLTLTVKFSKGKQYPIAGFNGFPKPGRISAMNRHLANHYTLKPGEMALVVKNGKIISRPGGGKIDIPESTFLLVASGAARPYLEEVQRDTYANLEFTAPGWENYPTILGAGPQLVDNGQVHIGDENFRPDVLEVGPRTAVGVDKDGNYIVVVADGRRPLASVGLTLNEMGATMLSLGAVNAINFDGGGSSAMAINGKLVNKPSDGYERKVSNMMMVLKP